MLVLRRPRTDQSGQMLAMTTISLVAMLAMVALVIDGGNAFSQQRITQNASDAAANAGAVVIAKNLLTLGETDAAVLAAVQTSAASNATTVIEAQYTDINGTNIGVTVGAAPTSAIPVTAAGVQVVGRRTFDGYVAGLIGLGPFDATTQATAVAGSLVEVCPSSAGCAVWPVTFPVTTVACDPNGDPILGTNYWPQDGTIVEVPLCRSGPGNVGWLDWYPPAGGADELADSIRYPNNPEVEVPDWYFVAQTGNVNAIQVEDALRDDQDELVIVPLFSATCQYDPGDFSAPGVKPNIPNPCPVGDEGNGQDDYYLFQAYAGFRLCGPITPGCLAWTRPSDLTVWDVSEGAYLQNTLPCTAGVGNTSCMFGRFESIVFTGTVVASPGNPGGPLAVGVQLIK